MYTSKPYKVCLHSYLNLETSIAKAPCPTHLKMSHHGDCSCFKVRLQNCKCDKCWIGLSRFVQETCILRYLRPANFANASFWQIQAINVRIHSHVFNYIYCNQLFDDWKTGLNNSPKYNTYIMFKSLPKHESYLSQVKNRKHRIAWTKLRVWTYDWRGKEERPIIPREEWSCPTCLHTVESEEHFITTCLLCITWIELFQRISIILPGFKNIKDKTAQFIFLLSQQNIKDKTAQFIFLLSQQKIKDKAVQFIFLLSQENIKIKQHNLSSCSHNKT